MLLLLIAVVDQDRRELGILGRLDPLVVPVDRFELLHERRDRPVSVRGLRAEQLRILVQPLRSQSRTSCGARGIAPRSRETYPDGSGTMPGRRKGGRCASALARFLRAVEVMGVEPTTSSMRPRRSSQLSYTPAGARIIAEVQHASDRPDRTAEVVGHVAAGGIDVPAGTSTPQPWTSTQDAVAASSDAWSRAFIAAVVRSPRLCSSTARRASSVRRRPLVTASG